MHVGNLSSTIGRLQDALDDLLLRWDHAREVWRDGQSQMIEEQILAELTKEVRQALPAVSQMAQVMSQAVRELEE